MRLFWRANLAQRWDYSADEWNDPERRQQLIEQERVAAIPEDANLVSSLCADGMHMPAIDIDLPCRLRETSEGRFHLFIDKKISEDHYMAILYAMAEAGIVERGFYELSVARGASFLRTHPKGERDHMVYPGPDSDVGNLLAVLRAGVVTPTMRTNPSVPVGTHFDYIEEDEIPF